jgi:arylsulfatase A-like enzyme
LQSYQNGLEGNGRTAFRKGLGPSVVEQLRRGGCHTALVGKWHIDPPPDHCGFAEAPLWLAPAASPYVDPLLRRGFGGKDEKTAGHITDLFSDAAIGCLRRLRQPFSLWLAFNAPHTPWYADEKYKKLYAGRREQLAPRAHPKGGPKFDWETYYAVITHPGEAVGRLTAELERAGL